LAHLKILRSRQRLISSLMPPTTSLLRGPRGMNIRLTFLTSLQKGARQVNIRLMLPLMALMSTTVSPQALLTQQQTATATWTLL
jgi:hypothetical protein